MFSATLDPEKSRRVREQLAVLKEQTFLSNALHEAQLLQLKMWGLLAMPHCNRVSIAWECHDRAETYVSINGTVGGKDSRPDSETLSILMVKLDEAVKDLLGNRWRVIVQEDGVQIFNFPPKDEGDGHFAVTGLKSESDR